MTSKNTYFFLILILFFCIQYLNAGAFYLQETDTLEVDNSNVVIDEDSLFRDLPPKPKEKNASSTGLDSIVVYSATDSVRLDLRSMKMRMKGSAKLNMKLQTLESEVITLDFKNSELSAAGQRDSTGRLIGYPKFNDQGEAFVGEVIRYNFKTKRGLISSGETEITEGYYFGKKIKRISESEAFVQDGYYTTCDNPHPHFYFGSPEMKIKMEDRIFLDPIIFYVEDLPIFAFPFGLFFPNKGGRQSGLIIPTFFFSDNRGVVLQDFGIYLALSDYYDTRLTTDFYSKGGYLLKNFTQWHLRDVFRGSANLSFGKTRINPEDEFTTQYSIGLKHNQDLTPDTKVDVNLDFKSSDYNRSTSTNWYDVTQQNVTSNASFSKRYDNGSNISLYYTRDQNIISNEFTQTMPRLTYSLPNIYPLKSIVSSNSWMKDISFSYSGSGYYKNFMKLENTEIDDTTTLQTEKYDYQSLISHTPSLRISPKFGYFTIQPSISFGANNYFRKLTRTFNSSDSSLSDSFENGFFTEYRYSFGLSMQTTIYGIADDSRPFFFLLKPGHIGAKAFRHTYQPRLSFSYTPDQSDNDDFFGTYNNQSGEEVLYSRFVIDGGGIASRSKRNSLSYSDLHRFEIKVAQGDTLPDKNIELLELKFNTGFNFAADSLKLDDIGLSFRTPSLGFLDFYGTAKFTPYDEDPIYNSETGEPTGSYRKVNRYLISSGKGLARLRSFSVELSSQFSDEGISFEPAFGKNRDTIPKDSMSLGDRFKMRAGHDESFDDIFGMNTPGYTPVQLPWTLSLGLRYDYNRPTINNKTENINLRATFTFKLTPTWSFNMQSQYDVLNKELIAPSINFTKDLHCWELRMTWNPKGYNQGFHLSFNIKSSQLSDLKLEKRTNSLYR